MAEGEARARPAAAVRVAVVRLRPEAGPLPAAATTGSAGFDLRAAISEPVMLNKDSYQSVPTGLALALPTGFEGQVRPRSGLAERFGVTLLNAPGTIDSDYRGEVHVLLINHGKAPFFIEPRMRVAQLVIARPAAVVWDERDDLGALGDTARGAGGFGSTGVR